MKRYKMNKKGFEISSMLGWILGILAVFIILFIVLGPNQLLSMAKSAAFSFGIGVPGGGPPPTGGGGSDEIPVELTLYFEDLFKKIDGEIKKTDKERCLIPLGVIPNPKDNYFITLSPGYVSIKKKIKENSYAATDKSQGIPGFEPCIVAGDGAKNFYNNWLDGSSGSIIPEYFDNIQTNSFIIIESEKKLKTPNEGPGGGRGYDISNKDSERYLYKADQTHFCFMPTWEDGFWPFVDNDCDAPTGGNLQKGLDNDCFKDIVKNIPICGAAETWSEILQNYEKNKCKVDKSTCEATNLPCQCFTLGGYDAKKEPETCTEQEPYCYEKEYGCHNAIDPALCKKVLGNDYVPPPKCGVNQNTCEVKNVPCSCDTAGSKSYPSTTLPETCTKNQYCYDGEKGCDNNPNTQSCKNTNPNFELPPKCEVDKTTCEVKNVPCSCDTAGSKSYPSTTLPETCIKNQYCYDGEKGCDNNPNTQSCKNTNP